MRSRGEFCGVSLCGQFWLQEGLFFTMGGALLSEFLSQILILVVAVIGIGFTLLQWMLVSRVKVGPEKASLVNNGVYNEFLIDETEEDGSDIKNVVSKCAEIQKAISFFIKNSLTTILFS